MFSDDILPEGFKIVSRNVYKIQPNEFKKFFKFITKNLLIFLLSTLLFKATSQECNISSEFGHLCCNRTRLCGRNYNRVIRIQSNK